MRLDWFTVIAQLINFLVLVALLRHFLYDRIISAMDAREARIAARLAEVTQQQEEASAEAAALRQRKAEFAAQRQQMLAEAGAEAAARRKKLLKQAQLEVLEISSGWQEALRREQRSFLRELRQRATQQVCAIARRALADLADAELERQVSQIFLRRLKKLTAEERTMFARLVRETIQQAQEELVISSAFTLPAETQQQIVHTLRDELAEDFNVRFEVVPALLCGIELRGRSRKIAWSLHDYLTTLEENLARLLEAEDSKASRRAGNAEADEQRTAEVKIRTG